MEDLLHRKPNVGPKRFLLWFSEALSALLAFVALNPFFVVRFGFHHFDSATVAGHFEPYFLQAKGPKWQWVPPVLALPEARPRE
jgi:hypothetical protein